MMFIDSIPLTLDLSVGGTPHTTAMWLYPPKFISTGADHTRPDSTHSDAEVLSSMATGTRPIIVIHGFRGDHHGMELIAHSIRRHPVIVPDLPGFGGTAPLPGGLTIDAYIKFLDGLVTAIATAYGQEPAVVGHSFGSIIVSHWAAHRPHLPALILINPITASPLDGPARFVTRLIRLYYRLGKDLPAKLGDTLLSNSLVVRAMSQIMVTTEDRGLRSYIHDQHAKYFSTYSDASSLAEAFDLSVSFTASEVADRLTMPVLVIAGNEDSIAPLEPTQEFVAHLPNAQARIFDGVGHLVHYERPEQTAHDIETFLDQLSTSPHDELTDAVDREQIR